jgi:hypothetical protein
MLPSVQSLADNIKALPTTLIPIVGATNFVGVVADFMNQVQAGSTGHAGIFTLNQAVIIATLFEFRPVSDNSWIEPFADIMATGITASIITSGTVTEPVWIGSGLLDTETLPAAASTITTIAEAKEQLITDLQNVVANNNSPAPLAQAISDCTLKFVFLCIGLGPPPTFIPIPIPLDAQ